PAGQRRPPPAPRQDYPAPLHRPAPPERREPAPPFELVSRKECRHTREGRILDLWSNTDEGGSESRSDREAAITRAGSKPIPTGVTSFPKQASLMTLADDLMGTGCRRRKVIDTMCPNDG